MFKTGRNNVYGDRNRVMMSVIGFGVGTTAAAALMRGRENRNRNRQYS